MAVFFALDMTNDEVRGIREKAVHVLHQIGKTWMVTLSALDIEDCADVFHDANAALRRDLYSFLGTVKCESKFTLSSMLKYLMENIKRIPEDQNAIFGCLKEIAEQNSRLVGM
jgi:hypothetical protein